MTMAENQQPWERDALEKLLHSTLKEQRAKRRWGIFFKSLFWGYLFLALWIFWPSGSKTLHTSDEAHTALIDINGEIGAEEDANADDISQALQQALKDPYTKGVILRINSPGGSAVQSVYIYDEIKRLRQKYPQTPIYAVCTDACASAAYLIASSTDKIYANPASLVGSIGVLMEGFGFVDAEKKLGIERRLITAGDHKGFFDPFSPISQTDVQYAQNMLKDIHQLFIDYVLKGRGKRLKITPDIFSGLVWTGHQALTLGLIDGYGSAGYVARDIIKQETIVDYSVKSNPLELFAHRFGAYTISRVSRYLQ